MAETVAPWSGLGRCRLAGFRGICPGRGGQHADGVSARSRYPPSTPSGAWASPVSGRTPVALFACRQSGCQEGKSRTIQSVPGEVGPASSCQRTMARHLAGSSRVREVLGAGLDDLLARLRIGALHVGQLVQMLEDVQVPQQDAAMCQGQIIDAVQAGHLRWWRPRKHTCLNGIRKEPAGASPRPPACAHTKNLTFSSGSTANVNSFTPRDAGNVISVPARNRPSS